MAVYSFSQVQKYISCPLSYKFRYIDEIIPEFEENLHLILGTTIHSTLERLYNQINNFKIPKIEEVKENFISQFDKSSQKLDKVTQEEIKTFKTRGINYLESFYNQNYPFKNIKVIGTEIQIYIDLGENIKFKGFIDRLDKLDKNFIITDYKTNKNLPPEDKDNYIQQLTLYGLGIKQKYGKYFDKLYGNLEYLHFGIKDFWEITEDKINEVRNLYIKLSQEIEEKKELLKQKPEKDLEIFPPKASNNCNYCEYKEICPLFTHFYQKIEYENLSDEAIRKLIDKYGELKNQIKELELQIDSIKTTIINFMKKNKLKTAYGNKFKLNLSSQKYWKIKDKEKLKELLKQINKIEELSDIDRFKLNKFIQQNQQFLSQAKDFLEETEINRLTKSEIKE